MPLSVVLSYRARAWNVAVTWESGLHYSTGGFATRDAAIHFAMVD